MMSIISYDPINYRARSKEFLQSEFCQHLLRSAISALKSESRFHIHHMDPNYDESMTISSKNALSLPHQAQKCQISAKSRKC